jgi:hypothetical protein
VRRTSLVLIACGALAGCGSSSSSSTTSSQSVTTAPVSSAATQHRAEACISVIGSFSKLSQSLKINSSSVAAISSTKEHLHELSTYTNTADQYTLGRFSEVLGRLESAIEKASGGNLAEANGALTGIGEEVKELIPKVLAMCGKTSGTTSTESQATPTPSSSSGESVSAAAGALAPICVTAATRGESNPPGVEAKVKALITAYEHDPSRSEDKHYLEVAKENLKSGCGKKYLPQVEAALAK